MAFIQTCHDGAAIMRMGNSLYIYSAPSGDELANCYDYRWIWSSSISSTFFFQQRSVW